MAVRSMGSISISYDFITFSKIVALMCKMRTKKEKPSISGESVKNAINTIMSKDSSEDELNKVKEVNNDDKLKIIMECLRDLVIKNEDHESKIGTLIGA